MVEKLCDVYFKIYFFCISVMVFNSDNYKNVNEYIFQQLFIVVFVVNLFDGYEDFIVVCDRDVFVKKLWMKCMFFEIVMNLLVMYLYVFIDILEEEGKVLKLGIEFWF